MVKKIIFLVIIILVNFCSIAYAGDILDIYSGASSFIQAGSSGSKVIDQDKVKEVSISVYNILLVIGIAVATIISAILGIKFMIGSVEEKSQIKETLVPFIIGCSVIFGAFVIWKIVVTIGNKIIV